MTIHFTHKHAETLRVLAKEIRASALLMTKDPAFRHDLPNHQETIDGLRSLAIRSDGEPTTVVLATQCGTAEREYDPNVAPCDDAEFGMKP